MSGWMEDQSAFPVHGGYEGDDPRNQIIGGGMTLRDYFAAKAMNSMLMPAPHGETRASPSEFDGIAKSAYKMADAMMKAREVKP